MNEERTQAVQLDKYFSVSILKLYFFSIQSQNSMDKIIIQRSVFPKIWKEIDSHHIILLNGARQVGKTTLLNMIMDKLRRGGVRESQIHYHDLENTNDLLLWDDQQSVLAMIQSIPRDSKHYFFIDEFQNAKTIGTTLKVIHDHHPNIKLIVTGSASWYLDINESLAGRKVVIPIWPFSFEEFLTATVKRSEWLAPYRQDRPTDNTVRLFNPFLSDFLTFGGYPEVTTLPTKEDKLQKLTGLLDAYLRKDIKLWNYAANTLEVKKLLSLLASQIGAQLSVSKLANHSQLGLSVVSNRLELLQNTFILHLIPPFFANKQKEIVKSPKTFLVDTGIRNSLLNINSIIPQTTDFGALAENFVVTELLKRRTTSEQVYFWRTKQGQEVDIVLKREDTLIPVEVKGGDQKTVPSGLRSFIRTYQPQKAFVLNWSIIQDLSYRDCVVHFRPLWFADKI